MNEDFCGTPTGAIKEPKLADISRSHRFYLFSLLTGGGFIIALIITTAFLSIKQSKAISHRAAETSTSNLSNILAENLKNTIEKIDFGIRGVLDEVESQQQSGCWDEKRIFATIAKQDARNPNAVGFRIFGPDGNRHYAVNTINSREANISQRADFLYLRDTPNAGLMVSPPVFGITAQQWIIVVARRITNLNGSFGGTVYGPIPIKKINKLYSSLDIGKKGIVALYHTNKQLATRFPSVEGSNNPIGKMIINDQLRRVIDSGVEEAQFDYIAAIDGVHRTASARKIPGYPYYIIVGFAESDYLAAWQHDRIKVIIVSGIMIGLVLLGMVFLYQRNVDRQNTVEQISRLAFFDHLTGLPNRTLQLDRLKQALASSHRSNRYGALLFIDLDNFKKLNDTLGHHNGDLLLKQVAERLINCVRTGDTVARIGGDEFTIVLERLGENQKEATLQVETVCNKIIAALCQTYQLEGAPYHCTASIGVALFKGPQVSIEDLQKQADLAMYKSKAAGRNCFQLFTAEKE